MIINENNDGSSVVAQMLISFSNDQKKYLSEEETKKTYIC